MELLASSTATINDDGNTITGRREKASDGRGWETDFDHTYRKVGKRVYRSAWRGL